MTRIFGKQTATLECWVAVPDTHNPSFFTGHVLNHPRQHHFTPGKRQATSAVVAFDLDNGLLETRNTIYRLGKPLNQ